MGYMSGWEKQMELDILDEMCGKHEITPKQYIIACKEVRRRDRTAKYAVELARALAPSEPTAVLA